MNSVTVETVLKFKGWNDRFIVKNKPLCLQLTYYLHHPGSMYRNQTLNTGAVLGKILGGLAPHHLGGNNEQQNYRAGA